MSVSLIQLLSVGPPKVQEIPFEYPKDEKPWNVRAEITVGSIVQIIYGGLEWNAIVRAETHDSKGKVMAVFSVEELSTGVYEIVMDYMPKQSMLVGVGNPTPTSPSFVILFDFIA